MFSDSEDELVLKAQMGQVEAFDSLLQRYESRLFRHIARFLGSDDSAYDVLQDTYIVIIRNIRKLRCRQSFGAWALGIATRKCLHAVRKKTKSREATFLEREFQNPGPSPAEFAIQKEMCEFLTANVDLLPGKLKAVILLHYEEELTLREVAAALGIAEGTVKSRLSAALTHLRSLVRKEAFYE